MFTAKVRSMFCFKSFIRIFALSAALTCTASATPAPTPSAKPITCPPGEYFVTGGPQSAYTKKDGVPYGASNHVNHCRAYRFSYKTWSKKIKDSRPTKWERTKEKSKKWTQTERKKILDALEILPSILLSDSVVGIHRMIQSSDTKDNPGSNFEGSIAIYDAAFSTSQNLARILSHELAHTQYRQLYDSNQWLPYASAAEWKPKHNPVTGKYTLVPQREYFTAEDGKISIDEDFSNNIDSFLFDQKPLKTNNPKIYEWIRAHYSDKFKVESEPKK